MKKSQLRQVIKEELVKRQPLNEDLDAILTKFIETDDATELKAYLKSLPDMARRKLAKIFKIELDEEVGYSKYAPDGTTKGGTTDDFRDILTAIAKSRPEEEDSEEERARRGNAILDKANPENVARITRGEEPIFKNESMFSPDYVTNLRPKGSFNELIDVDVYRNKEGGYDLKLNVYAITGRGMSGVRTLKFSDSAISMNEFTPDYAVERVGTVYNLSDKDSQEVRDFISNIPTSLG